MKIIGNTRLLLAAIFLFVVSLGWNTAAFAQKSKDKSYRKLEEKFFKAFEKDHPQKQVEICNQIISKAKGENRDGWLLWGLYARLFSIEEFSPDSVFIELEKLEKMCETEENPVTQMIMHSVLVDTYSRFYSDDYRKGVLTNVDIIDSAKLSPLYMKEWSSKQFKNVIQRHLSASMTDLNSLAGQHTNKYAPFISNDFYENWFYNHNASLYFDNDILHVIFFSNIEKIKEIPFSTKNERDSLCNNLTNRIIDYYASKGKDQAVLYIKYEDIVNQNIASKDKYLAYKDLYDNSKVENELKEYILFNMAKCMFSVDKTKALELCHVYFEKYPNGIAKRNVKMIQDKILNKEIEIYIPEVTRFKDSVKTVTIYKNVNNFVLSRAHVTSVNDIKNLKKDNTKFDIEKYKRIKKSYWEDIPINVSPKENYEADTIQRILPPTIKNGVYVYHLLADKKQYESKKYAIEFVTNLALVMCDGVENKKDLLVLDRETGRPIKDALVKVSSKTEPIGEFKSDSTGRIILTELPEDQYINYDVSIETDIGYPGTQFYNYSIYNHNEKSTQHKLVLFTDRSIYRPGQTVYFKGIAYIQNDDKVTAAGKLSFKTILRDANRKEISTQNVQTNEFGSFSGSFIIPVNSINGGYSISCFPESKKDFNCDQVSYFQVAEYKRPSFTMSIDKYKGLYKLGDTITISGNVRTLSDVAVSDADITVHVKSIAKARFDYSFEDVLYTKSDKNGKFSFELPLIPVDRDEYEATVFKIVASATSASGESESAEISLTADEESYQLSLKELKICKDNPVNNTFLLENLGGLEVNRPIIYELKNDKGEVVDRGEKESNKEVSFENWREYPSGRYKLTANIKGPEIDKEEDYKQNIIIFSFEDTKPIENTPLWCERRGDTVYFGTSFTDAVMFLDIVGNDGVISFESIPISNEIKKRTFKYSSDYGDGISLSFFVYREEALYLKTIEIKKPLPDKKLNLKWSAFRDKLQVGKEEKWKLKVFDKYGKSADAEIFALMYDASLDAIWPNQNSAKSFSLRFGRKINARKISSDNLLNHLITNLTYIGTTTYAGEWKFYLDHFDYNYNSSISLSDSGGIREFYPNRMIRGVQGLKVYKSAKGFDDEEDDDIIIEEPIVLGYGTARSNVNQNVPLRSNFAETAFFYPQLRTDAEGNVNIEFTLPESLTRWKFMALAHDKDLNYGTIDEEIVAQKDFMVAPNMPRFLRRGDKANIASTIYNLTQEALTADVKIELFDPATEKIYSTATKKVTIGANDNTAVEFQVPQYPDNVDILGVRIIAASENFSDGEQHLLSVLPNTTRVVESVPLTIRGNQTKTFSLESLFNHHSQSATNKALTVEYTGNPAWYAVMALPTLSQPESDNAVSWATSLYVNSISNTIVQSNPKIQNAIEAWKLSAQQGGQDVLQSKLFQNEELKNIVLNETPWVADAKNETEQMERISNLFNANNLHSQTANSIKKLSELQQSDGGWPWFKGMLSSRYITDYVLTLLARMEIYASSSVIGNISSDARRIESMQKNGIKYLGNCAKKEYDRIQEYLRNNPKAKDEGISYAALRYLYILAITYTDKTYDQMLKDKKIDSKYVEAFNYFLKKVNDFPRRWDMQEKAMVAVILSKAQRDREAKEVTQSIREHLSRSETQGMFFDFNENPWAWNRLKINAQTAAIEAINLVDKDSATVEEMKLWLLNQKRTQDWGSTTTTADAIYSLLMVGENPLDNEGVVEIDLIEKNKELAQPQSTQTAAPILNYVKEQFTDAQTVDAKSITVSKKDDGMAWGAVYATFNEKIDNTKEVGSEELSVSKELYVKRSVPFGDGYRDELQRITQKNPVKVGDIVTARMIIKVGREMEFVHLKDPRAVCFEPMGQLSGYRYGGGTWFYLEIKDAATNFFFERLSKGMYVLELNYRVSRTGTYSAGFATLQSAYAPDFSAHSAAVNITVE